MLPDERRDTQQARAVAKTVLFVYFSLAKIATFWFRWSVAFGLPLFARALRRWCHPSIDFGFAPLISVYEQADSARPFRIHNPDTTNN